jgi:hypothetical protein
MSSQRECADGSGSPFIALQSPQNGQGASHGFGRALRLLLGHLRQVIDREFGPGFPERPFAGNSSGVVKMDGKMLDKPHLRAAEKILALRGR